MYIHFTYLYKTLHSVGDEQHWIPPECSKHRIRIETSLNYAGWSLEGHVEQSCCSVWIEECMMIGAEMEPKFCGWMELAMFWHKKVPTYTDRDGLWPLSCLITTLSYEFQVSYHERHERRLNAVQWCSTVSYRYICLVVIICAHWETLALHTRDLSPPQDPLVPQSTVRAGATRDFPWDGARPCLFPTPSPGGGRQLVSRGGVASDNGSLWEAA